MKKTILAVLALLPLSAQAQVTQRQTTVIDTTPDTQVIDSSDVTLPSSCEFSGPISRNSPRFRFAGSGTALKKLRKAAEKVDANVILVTLMNLNSGIPMSGFGYRCSDLTEVTPSLKVFILPKD